MENTKFDINGKKFDFDGKSLEKTEIENLKSITKSELLSLDQETRIQFVKKLDNEILAWKNRKINSRTIQNIVEIDNLAKKIKASVYSSNSPQDQKNIVDDFLANSVDFGKLKKIIFENKNNPKKLNELFDQNLKLAKTIFESAGFNFPELSNKDINNPENFGKTASEMIEPKTSAIISGSKYLVACCLISPGYSYNSSSIEGITKRYLSFLIPTNYAKNSSKDSIFGLFKSMGLKDQDILQVLSKTLDPFLDTKKITFEQYENIKSFAKNFDNTIYFDSAQKYLRLLEVHLPQKTKNQPEPTDNLPGYTPIKK